MTLTEVLRVLGVMTALVIIVIGCTRLKKHLRRTVSKK